MAKKSDPPVVLIKWYDFTKWLPDRVDSWVQLVTRCVVGGYGSPERHFMGSSTNEVRRSVSANGVMSRKWRVWTAIEPEGIADSSLGQVSPRTRSNAAPGNSNGIMEPERVAEWPFPMPLQGIWSWIV